MGEIKIKNIETSSGFISLEKEWRILEKSLNHSNLTSSYDWLNTWWSVFKNVNNSLIGFNKKLIIIWILKSTK